MATRRRNQEQRHEVGLAEHPKGTFKERDQSMRRVRGPHSPPKNPTSESADGIPTSDNYPVLVTVDWVASRSAMSNMLMKLLPRKKLLLTSFRCVAVGPNKAVTQKVETQKREPTSDEIRESVYRKTHHPNKFERRILVWTGRYKTLEDVPDVVPIEALEKARNKARIRVSNYMMVLTLIACVGVAISGRRAAERGESLSQRTLDWHKQIREESKQQ
ncbi:hypothetical protein AAG570_014139 [Ranatra chinensis]|uniref:Uncharacterized protein n=1 Tax=Ranatra chinensis TaxID=642074 RepID=A0ABD0XTW6_9HEMI